MAIARASASSFLATYVEPDGRVVRRDQGGDTVSEGQAYALLLAEVAGRTATFARVWAWTRSHLLQPDGLLAYHATATRVLDPNAASDADVLAAWALLRYSGPDAAQYQRAGRSLAAAVLESELAYPQAGAPVLAAGPWATGLPATVDPSYFALPAFAALGAATKDARWAALSRDAVALTRSLTRDGALLPPDWARVDASGATPIAAPAGTPARVQYGLDAQRLVVWLAVSCRPDARALAAAWWRLLAEPGRSTAMALDQSGGVLDALRHPLPLVAAAAAAAAAGDRSDRDRLLAEADGVARRYPTYYGSAWAALGRALLTTSLLGGCG